MPDGSEFCDSCGTKMLQPPVVKTAPPLQPPLQQPQQQQPMQGGYRQNPYAPQQPQQQPGQQQYFQGYQQQSPYGYPTYQTYTPKKTNGLAIAGFVLALLGIQPVALILSILGLTECNKRQDNGRGLAVAGIILSALGVIFWVMLVASGVFFAIAEGVY
jgi:hypothetical protein